MPPTVIVTRRLPAEVEQALAARFDARLNVTDRPMTAPELSAALLEADAILCTVTDRLDASLFGDGAARCRMLANFGVGFSHIDVAAAAAAGIRVSNTPDVLTEATADLAMSLILSVARRTGEGERMVRSGAWPGWAPLQMLGSMVAGKTIGIIGYGRIGRAVARRASAGFGMKVVVHNPHASDAPLPAGIVPASLDELLAGADFVSLHCPATPATRHLIDGPRLARMRPGAFLINTSRGDVVDEAALIVALRSGIIAGAGLDVYEREPTVPEELLKMENVVLLPHLGSATKETRVAMGLRALDNLTAFFAGREIPDRVA